MSEKYDIQVGDRVTYMLDGEETSQLIISDMQLELTQGTIKVGRKKIIKIERPEYGKVYEKGYGKQKRILDEVEKKYLSNFLKPFKNRVETITKEGGNEEQYLDIYIKDDGYLTLPNFIANTMYKGMKLYKEYTLKELGLDK